MSDYITRTFIASHALELVGEKELEDIAQPTTSLERRVARHFEPVYKLTLRRAKWKAARETFTSTASASRTDDRYPTVVALPADCVAVWTVNDEEDGWERLSGGAGGFVAGAFSLPAEVVFTRRIEPHEMPEELAYLVGHNLALKIMRAPELNISAARRQELKDARDEAEDAAMDAAAAEGGITEQVPSRFMDAAYGLYAEGAHFRDFVPVIKR